MMSALVAVGDSEPVRVTIRLLEFDSSKPSDILRAYESGSLEAMLKALDGGAAPRRVLLAHSQTARLGETSDQTLQIGRLEYRVRITTDRADATRVRYAVRFSIQNGYAGGVRRLDLDAPRCWYGQEESWEGTLVLGDTAIVCQGRSKGERSSGGVKEDAVDLIDVGTVAVHRAVARADQEGGETRGREEGGQ